MKKILWTIIILTEAIYFILYIPLSLDTNMWLPEERYNTIFSLFILLPLLNFLPFGILLIIAKKFLKESSSKKYHQRKIGIIGAGIAGFITNLFINISVANSNSSTAAIALFLLPFYTSAIMPVGYFIGSTIAKNRK